MIIDRTHATTLNALADRLARLAPCHRDPHRFHEEKSEIVDQLRRLAQSGQGFPIEASNDTQTQSLRLRPSGKIPEAVNDNQRRTAA